MNDHTPARVTEPDDVAPAPAAVWSSEAEQSVLGALLIDNQAFERVEAMLTKASFWHGAHRLVWAAAAGLINAGKAADVVTVYERLQAAGDADRAGGIVYLNNLAASVPSAANVRRYAEIVADKATRRATIEAADKALTIARDTAPVADLLDRIAAEFAGIQATQMRKAPRRLSELVPRAIERYTDMANGKPSPAMPTGIPALDRLLSGGLRPGKLYGLAARPSVGKSSAARAIAIYLAAGGYPTLLLSQEMPEDEVTDCAIAQLGAIENDRLATGRLNDADWGRMTDAAEYARDLPLFVDDEGGLTIGQIRGKARMVKGVKVLVLDYLQLSTSTLKNATTNDKVAEISKGLKQLAMQMGVAILVLSQLSRAVEQRADREPQMSDLRDSGAIEQDLDVAIFLWTVREPTDGPRLVGWKVDKHRGGRKGRFGMEFDAPVYAWTDAPGQLPPPGAIATRTGGGGDL